MGFSSISDLIKGSNPYKILPSFRFLMRVDLAFDVPLKSVRPIMRENEYEPIQEGGLNDYVHLKRKPITKPYTIVVERYVTTDIDDPLPNGATLTLPLCLFIGRNVGKDMQDPTKNGRWFILTGAVVMSKEYGGLDSEKSGLLTETITIGYNSLYCVTNPVDEESDAKAYNFQGGTKTVTDALTGTTSTITIGNTERKHSDNKGVTANDDKLEKFKTNAKRWEFDEANPKAKNGKGVSSRQNNHEALDSSGKPIQQDGKNVTAGFGPLEEDKAVLVGRRKKWEWDTDKKDGNGVLMHQANGVYVYDSDGKPVMGDDGNQQKTGWVEPSKEEMAGKTHLWQMTALKGGSGAKSRQNFAKVTDENGKVKTDENGNEMSSGIGVDEKSATSEEWLGNITKWGFADNTKDGNGKRHVQNGALATDADGKPIAGDDGKQQQTGYGPIEKDKASMAKEAHLWTMSQGSDGKISFDGAQSRQNESLTPNEEKGETLASRTVKWDFDGTVKDGNGKRSRQNAQSTKDADGKETISGLGTTEPSIDDMAKATHRWKFTDQYTKKGNGVQSAANAAGTEGTADEVSASDLAKNAKQWGFDGLTKDGNGNRSRQNAEKTKGEDGSDAISGQGVVELSMAELAKGAALWKFTDQYSKKGGGVPSRVMPSPEEKTAAEMMNDLPPKKSYTNPKPTQPKARQWKFDENGSKSGSGEASRVPAKPEEASKETMASKAVKQTITVEPSERPQARKWEMTSADDKVGGGTASHKNPPGTEMNKGGMAGKAQRGGAVKQAGGKPQDARKWPQASSATKNENDKQKPAQRKWPQTKSATRTNGGGKKADQRRWPDQSSAVKEGNPGGEDAPARLWPETKSAMSITDFLMS